MRSWFINHSRAGDLVAIYVTKGKGPENMRGSVVGVLEISHKAGPATEFVSPERWSLNDRDPNAKGKWQHALQATRAWRIVREEFQPVEELFPKTYRNNNAQRIGSQCVQVDPSESPKLFRLQVYETRVYKQIGQIDGSIQPLHNALNPSKAVMPASEPFWVGETDGPKHLYVLRLDGDIRTYLGREDEDLTDKLIVKVGFSRSPTARCEQIQAAYPDGKFKWRVMKPDPIPGDAPYSCAKVAIAGEDEMKRTLKEHGESLGREFFLADAGAVQMAWGAGRASAERAETDSKPGEGTTAIGIVRA